MAELKVINIEQDFGRYPAGRYVADGPYSGAAFRDNVLIPALRSGVAKVSVEFDGARGYASSFLEEAFGGLVRAGFDANDLISRLDLRSKDESLLVEVKEYIREQAAAKQAL